MHFEYIKNLIRDKKILILGFGREGKSTYNLIKKIGGYSKLSIADQNEITGISEDVFFGPEYQDSIVEFDVVFKSPGVVLKDRTQSEKITSQTDIIISCYRDKMIGITGTKGKSTTTSLIYHILKHSNKNPILMGNIGIPAFDAIEEAEGEFFVVYELSCHQLEFATESPHRSVLLNIYPEHLDHYGTFEKYRAAKENIYRNMNPDDFLVCGHEFLPAEPHMRYKTISFSDNKADYYSDADGIKAGNIYLNPQCKLFGAHNMYNIAAAYAICSDAGVTDEEFLEAIKSYVPLPHRLELFAEINGVRYIDDSISTIPETAINALKSVKNVGTIILGGMDRGVELDTLCDYLISNPVPNVVLMYDTGNILYEKLIGRTKSNIVLVSDLEQGVIAAKKLTKSGEACVLSPAAASYGFFKNFEERGDVFKSLIKDC